MQSQASTFNLNRAHILWNEIDTEFMDIEKEK